MMTKMETHQERIDAPMGINTEKTKAHPGVMEVKSARTDTSQEPNEAEIRPDLEE
jgi:hypothetical protein